MKYVKLFESWLNEAEAGTVTIPDQYKKSPAGTSISVPGIAFPGDGNAPEYDLGKGYKMKFSINPLDTQTPSNKKVSGGITFKTNFESKPNANVTGRWTIDPVAFLSLVEKKDQAAKIKAAVESKMKEILEKYSVIPVSTGGYDMTFDGKEVSFYSGPSGGKTEYEGDLKKALNKDQITTLKKFINEGVPELKKALAEIENQNSDFFSYEIKAASALPSGMKLLGVHPVGDDPTQFNPKEIADKIKEYEYRMKNSPKMMKDELIGTHITLATGILSALTYAWGKASAIENLASKPDAFLYLVGLYGNTENKFLAEVSTNWDKMKNIAKANGAKEKEVEKYAPKPLSTKQAQP